MKGNWVAVDVLPNCDVCGAVASYDALLFGSKWGYACQECFDNFGAAVGLGLGQRLVLRK
jgi:hypothetical protein